MCLFQINRTFDVLNSGSKFGKKYKAAMTPENKDQWMQWFDEAEEYLASLTETANNGKLIVDGPRKRGFLGFIVCLRSAKQIFERLVENEGSLKYLLTYKLSQDHIEMFFGSIRRRNGCNNNPTCRIFKSAYKRLVVYNEICSTENSNVVDQFDLKILKVSSRRKNQTEICDVDNISFNDNLLIDCSDSFLIDSSEMLDALISDHNYAIMSSSDLSKSMICEYMAGFVARKLRIITKCDVCCDAIIGTNDDLARYAFLELKQEGGLTIPSDGVVKICKITERLIREISPDLSLDLNYLLSKNIPLRVAICVAGMAGVDLFPSLNEHIFNLPLDNNHINELIKVVAKTYLDIRVHHAAKMENLKNGASSRSMLSRQIIDKHL